VNNALTQVKNAMQRSQRILYIVYGPKVFYASTKGIRASGHRHDAGNG
jgi:hypothetical protein